MIQCEVDKTAGLLRYRNMVKKKQISKVFSIDTMDAMKCDTSLIRTP